MDIPESWLLDQVFRLSGLPDGCAEEEARAPFPPAPRALPSHPPSRSRSPNCSLPTAAC